MAQYYTKPHRNASRNARPLSSRQETLISTQNWEDSLATPSASFYVFPNPSGSTSPPSARDPPSTEVTLSPYSEIPLIEGSSLPTPILLTSARGRENVWEWPKDLKSILVSPPHRPQLNRTKHWTPRIEKKPLEPGSGVFGARGGDRRTFSPGPARGRGTPSGTASEVPNEVLVVERSPSISSHVPFLSFFTSLLSTDRTTRRMVTNLSIPSLFYTTNIPPEASIQRRTLAKRRHQGRKVMELGNSSCACRRRGSFILVQ
ncbi:hypothetical protein FA13DRAFT_1723964 [Coprinellus micaceus]|uniref:Uncharacterized protein n=1 Tax=Coprinellus micaceus TaxID=71717 RepID=A0A4Y7TZY8_COPMI|nr:hypothetical protein FA13DRAFT_1723964 [Coprinellus micaceus]